MDHRNWRKFLGLHDSGNFGMIRRFDRMSSAVFAEIFDFKHGEWRLPLCSELEPFRSLYCLSCCF